MGRNISGLYVYLSCRRLVGAADDGIGSLAPDPFLLVGVIILVRLGAKALERVLEVAQLGTFNRVAGALLYSVVLLSVCAATFQGLQWAGVVTAAERQSSFFLQHVEPFFMEAFRGVSRWIPGKGDVFESLERYFQSQRSAAPVL